MATKKAHFETLLSFLISKTRKVMKEPPQTTGWKLKAPASATNTTVQNVSKTYSDIKNGALINLIRLELIKKVDSVTLRTTQSSFWFQR